MNRIKYQEDEANRIYGRLFEKMEIVKNQYRIDICLQMRSDSERPSLPLW